MSLGRCCTSTAVRTGANGNPETFAAGRRGASAAGPRDGAPHCSLPAGGICRGSPISSLLFLSGTHRSFSGIYLEKTVGSVFGVASLPLGPPVTQR
jgi:hypothetical protein